VLSHLSDGTLRRELDSLAAADRRTTAKLLIRLAEFEHRRLYAEDGCSSLFTFCVEKLHFSEDIAFKRIRVARAARRCPALLRAIADGRLHLTGAVFLAPYLKSENFKELIESAAHKTKAQIELLIAQRFPRPDVASMVRAIAPAAPKSPPAPDLNPPAISSRSWTVPSMPFWRSSNEGSAELRIDRGARLPSRVRIRVMFRRT
jgi:hypothetical protein